NTPLFVGNGFLSENSSLIILWALQYTDHQNRSCKTYKKIRQEINPTFHGEGDNIIVTLRSMSSYPTTNVTNELAADFLMILQKSYPDVRVEKVKPTCFETLMSKIITEKKELETKLLFNTYCEEYETFKQY